MVIVAGDVFAELFEVAALADLPLRVHAKGAPVEEQRREAFPFVEQLG